MITAIVLGLLRHFLTTLGGTLVAYSINFVGGLPVVHNLETALIGVAAVVGGGTLSVLNSVKTQSGAIYKTND